jgi:hypothetical protein
MVKTHVRQLLGDAKTKVRSNDVLLRKKKKTSSSLEPVKIDGGRN